MNSNLYVSEEPGDRVRLSGRCVVTGKPYSVVLPLSGAIDYFERGRNIAEAFPSPTGISDLGNNRLRAGSSCSVLRRQIAASKGRLRRYRDPHKEVQECVTNLCLSFPV